MNERVSSEEAEAILLEHGDEGETICLICRGLRDLLDAREERDEARPVLEVAREHEGGRRGEYVMSEAGELRFVAHGIHCEICKAVREYDAARAAAEEE